ncbi:hypothetical protein KGO95_03905 [Patescibacteria group bacterium]|nr:hypothetical protein [Patescibacteria group bacterium]
MKMKPTWQFFVILAVAFCFGGMRGALIAFGIMMAIVALSLGIYLLTFEDRAAFVQGGVVRSDGIVIRLLCKLGMHTHGEVTEAKPLTKAAKKVLHVDEEDVLVSPYPVVRRKYESVFAQRAGMAHCVCCKKELLLNSFLYCDRDGRPRWRLDEFNTYKEVLALNRS